MTAEHAGLRPRDAAAMISPPPLRQVSERALDALRPPGRGAPVPWVQRNVFFPSVSSATPRPYDFYLFPHHRGVWEAYFDPSIREIYLRWAAQHGGKTALMTGIVAYLADQDPAPAIWGGPDERLIKRAFTRKLYPVLRESHATSRLLPPRHLQKNDEIDLRDMVLYSAHSGSVSALGDISARDIFANEIDKWSTRATAEGDPLALIMERKKAFRRWKFIGESTPSESGISRIDAAIERSDDRRYWVPCPHCGQYQVLEFERLALPHDLAGRLADEETCRREAYYPCSACSKRIEDHERLPIFQRGVWARRGEAVRPDGTVEIVDRVRHRPGSVAGFTISSLYAAAIGWGEIGAEWAKAQGDIGRIRAFVNGWLARSYAPRSRVTSEEEVLRHRGLEEGLGYARDTCPEQPLACFLCVDVQEECLWYTAWAWTRGRRRYLLRYGQLPRELDTLLPVAGLRYTACGPTGRPFRASHVLIDSGYRTKEVYAWCEKHRAIPTKGSDQGNRAQPITWSKLGAVLQLLSITVLPFKDALADAIQRSNLTDPGAWRLFATCELDFARQMTAEKRITERDKWGRDKTLWVNPGGRDNHYWDTCVTSEAAALALEWMGFSFEPAAPPETPPRPAGPMEGGMDADDAAQS